jgi:DNA polymerase-1
MIDGDIVLYQACSGAETETEWEPEQWHIETDLRVAKKAARIQLADILFRSGCDDLVIAISSSDNYRKDIYPEYKATRAGKRKPVGYKALKDWMPTEYQCIMKPKLEGDDVMGIFATRSDAGKVVLWSLDKDIATIPGNFMQGKTKRTVQPHEADYYWLCQTMAGDQVDNYPGCKGIGMKTAEKLLGKCTPAFNVDVEWRKVVLPAFIKAGFDEDYALTQARCARILRFSDWDNEKQEPILWTPQK